MAFDTARPVPEDALAQVERACALLVDGTAVSIAEAGDRFGDAAILIARSQGNTSAVRTVPASEFRRSLQRAGRLLGAIGEWQRHRRALIFPDETSPRYGANGKTVIVPAAGSMTMEG